MFYSFACGLDRSVETEAGQERCKRGKASVLQFQRE